MAWKLHAIEQMQLYGDIIASMAWGAQKLISTQVGIGCSADDFDAAQAKLSEKFKDDEKEIQAEFCAEIGFGLHNLIGTTQPATGGPDPYGGPPQFAPPPNFAP